FGWKKTGNLRNEEMVILTKQGQKRTVLLTAGSVKDTNGNLIYSTSVQVDITNRKRIQEKLRVSQNRLEGIVASAMDAIIAIDDERRIVIFNSAARRMFGCPARDAIGSPIDRFIPERFRAPYHACIQHLVGGTSVATRSVGSTGAL